MNIIDKIKQAGLIGRGGAGFPTHLKWQAVKDAHSKIKYLVINGAEGEPGVYKDKYILVNHLDELAQGVKLAADCISITKIYFYLNPKYFDEYKKNITSSFNKVGLKGKFELFKKPSKAGYIGGEESTILNIIEGEILEPRLKPPFPTECGLWGQPTLINNIETLYNVSLVNKGKYKNNRFYSVNVNFKNKGVYELSSELTIAEVLKKTGNYPEYKFFVQVGGDAAGEVLNDKQLDQKVSGAGSITIFDFKKHNPEKLVKFWFDFFADNSCGQCTPCREGTYRLREMFNETKSVAKLLNNNKLSEIIENLNLTPFCALGSSIPMAISSYLKNVYNPNK